MYFKDMKDFLKPFDLSSFKVELITLISTVVTIISTFSENYLGISGAMAGALFILLIVDFLTGIRVAAVTKDKITSRKGLRSLYKAGVYILFMYIAFMLHKELESTQNLFSDIIKYFHIYIIIHISFWELFSIDENLKKLGVDLGITDLLKTTYASIKKIFSKIEDTTPKEKEPSDDEPNEIED